MNCLGNLLQQKRAPVKTILRRTGLSRETETENKVFRQSSSQPRTVHVMEDLIHVGEKTAPFNGSS